MRAEAILLNTPLVEAWPGGLLRARGNHDARLLATADHVLRRKRDGAYLAVERAGALEPLRPAFASEPGLEAAMAAIGGAGVHRRPGIEAVPVLPLSRLQERLARLGPGEGYGERSGVAGVAGAAGRAAGGCGRRRPPARPHPA